MSDYRLQIVNRRTGGAVVEWAPGKAVESDLIDELCRRLKKHGIGVFRSEKRVCDAVKAVWSEMLWDLKVKVG